MKCLLCSDQTFEKKLVKQKKKLVSGRDQSSRDGLTCSKCKRFACKECVAAFVEKAGVHGNHDPWCIIAKKYVLCGEEPENFVGHCCELKFAREKGGEQKKKKIGVACTRYDGCLHLPDFGVLIGSDFVCTDVHGLVECAEAKTNSAQSNANYEESHDPSSGANYYSHFGPVAHCVIGQRASERYHSKNVVASGDAGDYLGIFTINVGSVEDPTKMQEVRRWNCIVMMYLYIVCTRLV